MENTPNTPNIQQTPPQNSHEMQPSTLFNGEYYQPYGIADLPTAQPIKKRSYTVFESISAVICLAMGFLFIHYCFAYIGGIFGGAFWALFGALAAVFAKVKKLPVKAGHIAVFAVAELFCFVPLFCANRTINTLAAFFVFGLFCYLGVSLSGAKLFGDRFVGDLFRSVFVRPFASFGECPKATFGLFGRLKAGKNVLYVLLGLLIALPLTLVVAALLISSDAMFADLMSGILDYLPEFSFDTVSELIWGIPVAFFLCGILFSAEKKLAPRTEEAPACRVIPLAAVCTAVTPICVFYLMYVLVQFRYLIAALGGSLPEEYSYSDFARQGFFELCAVAAIDLFVILLMQAFTVRRENDRRPAALKAYTVIISVFTLLLIATAVSKMLLYIGEYGMTPLRIYTSWFMAVLAVLFVIIMLWQFVKLPLWKTVFAAFTVMFGVLCFSNTDGIIARYNISAYQSGALTEVDFSLLQELGTSAIPAVADAYEANPYYASQLLGECNTQLRSNREDAPEKYAAYFSIPRLKAEQTLAENEDLLEGYYEEDDSFSYRRAYRYYR